LDLRLGRKTIATLERGLAMGSAAAPVAQQLTMKMRRLLALKVRSYRNDCIVRQLR
jgi:hypothetical protein